MEDCNVGCSEFLAQKNFGMDSEEDRHDLTFHTCNTVLYFKMQAMQKWSTYKVSFFRLAL